MGGVGGRLIVTPVNPPPESAAVDEIEMGQVPFNFHLHFNFYPSGEPSSAYVIWALSKQKSHNSIYS